MYFQVDSGYLKHVYAVFERLGFERTNGSDWDVLWAHMYPFRVLYTNMTRLKPHQKVISVLSYERNFVIVLCYKLSILVNYYLI